MKKIVICFFVFFSLNFHATQRATYSILVNKKRCKHNSRLLIFLSVKNRSNTPYLLKRPSKNDLQLFLNSKRKKIPVELNDQFDCINPILHYIKKGVALNIYLGTLMLQAKKMKIKRSFFISAQRTNKSEIANRIHQSKRIRIVRKEESTFQSEQQKKRPFEIHIKKIKKTTFAIKMRNNHQYKIKLLNYFYPFKNHFDIYCDDKLKKSKEKNSNKKIINLIPKISPDALSGWQILCPKDFITLHYNNLFDTVDRESCSAFHIVYNRQVVLFQSNRKSKYSASNKWMSNQIEFKKMKSHKRKK